MPHTWWLRSNLDPRWDVAGHGEVQLPAEAEMAIEEKKRELGIQPPPDLEFGCVKD